MHDPFDTSPGREPIGAEFGISSREVDEYTCVVTVEGELDLASAPALKWALIDLLAKGYDHYVIDLSGLTHMDSMGLGVLVGFRKRIEEDGRLAIAGMPAQLSKLLGAIGLDDCFDSYATLDDALVPPAADNLPFNTDAAMALGLASTAMPFAASPQAEALRWLRILRLHGEAARVLCALGIGELPLPDADADQQGAHLAPAGRQARDAVTIISERAVQFARERNATAVGTGDILIAVMAFYGPDFERVLAAHGTDRDEVIGQLGAAA
jgi:anti-sigma B factor antagonist